MEQPRPTKPWQINSEPYSGAGVGNIADFTTKQDMSKWTIGNTSTTAANKLKWHKIQDGNKTLLICDRVILAKVSWDDLNGQGYITGKTITVDGQQYKCRVLTGGSNYRNSSDAYAGGKPASNEWDRLIVNEDGMSGAPAPNSTDLGSGPNASQASSTHNQTWNWMGMYSWCQETYSENSAYRAGRGYYSARYWNYHTASVRADSIGWRPALEILNSAPLVSGSDTNLGDLSTPPTLTYQVSDSDGDPVTVTEKLNTTTLRTVNNMPYNTQQTITITNEQWNALPINTQHTVSITASDGKGGVTVRTYTFTRVNAAPVITGVDGSIGDKNGPFDYVYQVTDADDDAVDVIERFRGQAINTRTNIPLGQDLTISITSTMFAEVPINGTATITIEATDSANNTSYRNITFRRVNAAAVVISNADADLGLKTSPPTIIYQVSDPEDDEITVTEKLNNVLLKTISSAAPDTDMTLSIPYDTWLALGLAQHTITIRATDSHGAYSERSFTFTRADDRVQIVMRNAVETTAAAEKIIPSINAIMPAGSTLTVQACNNGFDETPTWEDATDATVQRKAHVFTNEEKVADNWGIKVQITLERGDAIGECAIMGYGAAFE